jgi:L-tyrosine C(3)-methyltransferase
VNGVSNRELTQDDLNLLLFGHAAFQYLRAGCELGLFELLEHTPGLDRPALRAQLNLQPRAMDILLMGVTALRLVQRTGDTYSNSKLISQFISGKQWDTFQAAVGFEAYVNYPGLADFTESLRADSNVGLRRIPGDGPTLYHRLTQNEELSEVFFQYMHSWSEMVNHYLVELVDFTGVRRLLDVGGGDGVNSIALARAFPDLEVTVLELAAVVPRVQKRIAEAGLSDRVQAVAGDMFAEPLPTGYDRMLFAHQMQIWPLAKNTQLLTSAYQALGEGGKVIIINSMSDDSGDGPLFAALDSAYFAALPGGGGMLYSWRQLEECLRKAGFATTERIPCEGSWTPHGILVGSK